jgi:hypothetical protein
MDRRAENVIRRGLAIGILSLAALTGCARAIAPTGGEVPSEGLRVTGSNPESMQTLAPFNGPVRIQFERTLAERPISGSVRDAVLVSPLTGEVSVRQRGSRLEIRMEGGFSERTVYQVTVLPRFQDRFRNTQARPYELFFSTGPEFDETLLAGLVTDRLTGNPVLGARVEAIPEAGAPVYVTVADSAGVFAFRYLPADRYELRAWDDRNRNRLLDPSEAVAEARVSLASADTLVVTELPLLTPDTTAAILRSAQVVDSLTLELTFDDPLDPESSLEGVRAELLLPEDAERPEEAPSLPGILEILHNHQVAPLEEEREGVGEEVPEALVEAPAAEETVLLPRRTLIVRLETPLPYSTRIRIRVEGVENLNRVAGGGGEVVFQTPEPPPPAAEDPPADDPPPPAP